MLQYLDIIIAFAVIMFLDNHTKSNDFGFVGLSRNKSPLGDTNLIEHNRAGPEGQS